MRSIMSGPYRLHSHEALTSGAAKFTSLTHRASSIEGVNRDKPRLEAAMGESDSLTAPWGNMMHHRVAVADHDSMAEKILKLLHLRKGDSEHQLWGTASAQEQARAMLGGTTGSRDISSVLGSATRSSGPAKTGRTTR